MVWNDQVYYMLNQLMNLSLGREYFNQIEIGLFYEDH